MGVSLDKVASDENGSLYRCIFSPLLQCLSFDKGARGMLKEVIGMRGKLTGIVWKLLKNAKIKEVIA